MNISLDENAVLGTGVLGSPTGVRAPLRFIKPQSTKPTFLSAALTGGEPKLLFASEDHLVTITDLRAFAGDLSLDHEGFELLTRPSRVTDFCDDDLIERVYHPEIEALLVGHLRASRVVISMRPAARTAEPGRPTRTACGGRPATSMSITR